MVIITDPTSVFLNAGVHYAVGEQIHPSMQAPIENDAIHLGNLTGPLPPLTETKSTLFTWTGSLLDVEFVMPKQLNELIFPDLMNSVRRFQVDPFDVIRMRYTFSQFTVYLQRKAEPENITVPTHLLGEDGTYTAIAFDGLCRALVGRLGTRRKTDGKR